jgi:hypothetical protein
MLHIFGLAHQKKLLMANITLLRLTGCQAFGNEELEGWRFLFWTAFTFTGQQYFFS